MIDIDEEWARLVVMDPDANPQDLMRIGLHGPTRFRYLVAAHPRTSPDILDRMCVDSYNGVVVNIIENPNTWISTLRRLKDHMRPDVRWILASNQHTPMDVLEFLTHDREGYIRRYASEQIERRGLIGLLGDS